MWFLLRDTFQARNLGIGDPGRIPGGNIPPVPSSSSSARGVTPADAPAPLTASMDFTVTAGVVEDIAIIPDSTRTSMCRAVDLDDLPGTANQVSQTCREQVMRLDQSLYRYESAILATQESVLDDLPELGAEERISSTNSEFVHPDGGFNTHRGVIAGFNDSAFTRDMTPEEVWSASPPPDLATVGPGTPDEIPTPPSGDPPASSVLDDLGDMHVIA